MPRLAECDGCGSEVDLDADASANMEYLCLCSSCREAGGDGVRLIHVNCSGCGRDLAHAGDGFSGDYCADCVESGDCGDSGSSCDESKNSEGEPPCPDCGAVMLGGYFLGDRSVCHDCAEAAGWYDVEDEALNRSENVCPHCNYPNAPETEVCVNCEGVCIEGQGYCDYCSEPLVNDERGTCGDCKRSFEESDPADYY